MRDSWYATPMGRVAFAVLALLAIAEIISAIADHVLESDECWTIRSFLEAGLILGIMLLLIGAMRLAPLPKATGHAIELETQIEIERQDPSTKESRGQSRHIFSLTEALSLGVLLWVLSLCTHKGVVLGLVERSKWELVVALFVVVVWGFCSRIPVLSALVRSALLGR